MEDHTQLLIQLEAICASVTEKTYADCVRQGYFILMKLHDFGLTQEQVYHPLLQYHNGLENELSRDCIADMMDFVVGWCAPQWYIWRSDGRFDRTI